MTADTSVLRGTVEQVLFHNEDSGWTVVRLAVKGEGPTTVVGTLGPLMVRQDVEVTGKWTVSPKYGRQFRAEHAVPMTPRTEAGILAYLASGVVEGLGPALAERLVQHFGPETLTVAEKEPDRLTEVSGIGSVKAARIRDALAAQLGLRSVMVFLHGLGISPALATRIHRRYGPRTVDIVRTHPFRLALDVPGVGFRTADRIAGQLGVPADAPERAQAGLLHVLAEAASDGHVLLPRTDLLAGGSKLLGASAPMEPALQALQASGHVVVDEDPEVVYAATLYAAETEVLTQLTRLDVAPATVPSGEDADDAAALDAFEEKVGLRLAAGQRAALALALRHRVVVVTGGPGTGKTTLVRAVVFALRALELRLQLCAPTGRAAKRMTEATGVEARTIHRLLAYDPRQRTFIHGPESRLTVDALIVDEVSMVDLPLMAALLSALPDRARLILVGDVDQLPSVGPGQVLRDLIDSGQVPTARLEQVFRQTEGSRITTNAHRINRGQLPEVQSQARGARSEAELSDFYLIERTSPPATISTLLKVVAERIPGRFGLDAVDDVQVLTPMHRGDLGAVALNERLQALLNPDGPSITRGGMTFRVGDKVMQTRNDYELGVLNGDIGRLVFLDADTRKLKVAFDEREVTFEPAQQDALTLAYAMSIHKSQGSEYPAVVIPLTTQHAVMLHRNLLYTAVTRGKKLVVLVGTLRALRLAVNRTEDLRRHSRLAQRLRQVVQPA